MNDSFLHLVVNRRCDIGNLNVWHHFGLGIFGVCLVDAQFLLVVIHDEKSLIDFRLLKKLNLMYMLFQKPLHSLALICHRIRNVGHVEIDVLIWRLLLLLDQQLDFVGLEVDALGVMGRHVDLRYDPGHINFGGVG